MTPPRLLLPAGRIHDLCDGEDCSIGRDPDNTLHLDDNLASRHHALLRRQGNRLRLVDLGSSNGTYVNGRRLSRPHPLVHGDRIEIGSTRITFDDEAASGSAHDTAGPGATLTGGVVPCNCWLMLADIEGATEKVRTLSAEEWRRVSGNWYKECRDIIESHGGEVVHHLGDGFLCHWYDGTEAKRHVLDALRRLAAWQTRAELPFRLVLHLGKTARTNVPPNGWTFIGPEMHFVFRLEKIAGSRGRKLLCSQAAWERLNVPSLAIEEAEAKGYDGVHRFHVPDLDAPPPPP